jgi:hypothetical protein
VTAYDEIARKYEEEHERGEDGVNLVPVTARRPRKAESIYSLRFTGEELTLLSKAAQEEGIKLSQFIREAALNRAGGGITQIPPSEAKAQWDRIEDMVRALGNRPLVLQTTAALLPLEIIDTSPFGRQRGSAQTPSRGELALPPGVEATAFNSPRSRGRNRHG